MIRLVYDQCLGKRIKRREMLQFGGLGALSLLGRRAPASPSSAAKQPGFGKAKSVIIIYASGGQSQLETWDPKPDAPLEIRGEFAPISTSVPGVQLTEHMPRLAKLADRYTILRSVCHDDFDHGSATYLALTGRPHIRKSSNPLPMPTDYPTFGSALQRVRPSENFPYTAVHLNGPALVPIFVAPGQFAGILGPEYEPLVIGDVRSAGKDTNLGIRPDLPTIRLQQRKSLLQSVESYTAHLDQQLALREKNYQYEQAFKMLSMPECRNAFDLSSEPPALRDRYGRHRSGQACLLARKLVQAGVPYVNVIWNHSNRGQDEDPTNTDEYGWDTHNDIFVALRKHLLPRFDESFSALLEDLEATGLLDETLVVCMGEFGRAPRVAYEANFAGHSPGRKHWASVYSIVMAGAGVGKGQVFGESDRIAAYPKSDPVGPWDIAATIFSCLGIDPEIEYSTPLGQPVRLTLGKPIHQIFG